jgi:exopolyphosphatase/guanosine-5'-triphosphate,3'-diphosphate pyrophosphatase
VVAVGTVRARGRRARGLIQDRAVLGRGATVVATPGHPRPDPGSTMARVAAVDCGTNSIRLLVADVDVDGRLRDVHREMRVVRLGQGVDATGRLAPDAVERTRVALVDYAAVIARAGADRVRMVATSATRDAENREDFFGMVRSVLGVDAEVVTGDEEARLSFAGAVGELDPEQGPFLVVDLGGGSTELVLGDAGGVAAACSVDVGCVRLTERCLHGDPPSAQEVAEARGVANEVLAAAFAAVPVERARTWVGVAGTFTTLAAVAAGLQAYDSERIHLSRVGLDRLHGVCADLVAMTRAQRAALGPVHPGRVDVIGGGALVCDVLAAEVRARAGLTELVVSEHDILDGIALSLG